MILVRRFARENDQGRRQIYELYLAHARLINNWDLVDGSAPYIVGAFLWSRNRQPLYVLAKSPSLWERRIAILSTFHFIRQNDFGDALRISRLLLGDEHDLIHKAVGWMLREIGKRDRIIAETFLKMHYWKCHEPCCDTRLSDFRNRAAESICSGRFENTQLSVNENGQRGSPWGKP
jgi:hypothetical protein